MNNSCVQELNDENINQSIRDRLLILMTGIKAVGHCPMCTLFVLQRELIKEFHTIASHVDSDEIIKAVMAGTTDALGINAAIEVVNDPRGLN